mmetsp:Transcript_8992/g.22272  ORF Transcript_8992/g.22272 Transcript_8992/m.22272 type:complete len:313 (+) Transcript_8992:154-1092(+)
MCPCNAHKNSCMPSRIHALFLPTRQHKADPWHSNTNQNQKELPATKQEFPPENNWITCRKNLHNSNMIVYLRYLNVTGRLLLSRTKSIFGSSLSNRTSRFLRIFLVPAIFILMVVHQLHTTTWKWVHDFSNILMVFVATYLTMIVMVECTARILLLKAGIGLESTVNSMSSNPYNMCIRARSKAALNRCIERSLIEGNPRRSSACCSICLETPGPGESIVSGRKNCCKSNVFHEECIKQWLMINDSCPCCRQPMLDEVEEEQTEPTLAKLETNNIHNHDFWAQLKDRVDTVTRLRDEVLSYFVEFEHETNNL